MVVPAEHQVHRHIREGTENPRRVLESVALRELALDRIVVHNDDACIACGRLGESSAQTIDLLAPYDTDDRDVAQAPGKRLRDDTVRRVQPRECRAPEVGDP